MKIRAAVAFGFGMKIPVFDVDADCQAHVGVRRAIVCRAQIFPSGG